MDIREERLERIMAWARTAFGEAGAERWSQTPWRVFDHRRPVEMTSEEPLTQRVIDFLQSLCAADESAIARA